MKDAREFFKIKSKEKSIDERVGGHEIENNLAFRFDGINMTMRKCDKIIIKPKLRGNPTIVSCIGGFEKNEKNKNAWELLKSIIQTMTNALEVLTFEKATLLFISKKKRRTCESVIRIIETRGEEGGRGRGAPPTSV